MIRRPPRTTRPHLLCPYSSLFRSGGTSRISGSVYPSGGLDGTVGHTGFELQGLAGTLAIPGLEMAPQPVRDLTMRGRYDSTQARFDLDEARVSLGSEEAPGPVLNIAGIFDHAPLSRGRLIDADATLQAELRRASGRGSEGESGEM